MIGAVLARWLLTRVVIEERGDVGPAVVQHRVGLWTPGVGLWAATPWLARVVAGGGEARE